MIGGKPCGNLPTSDCGSVCHGGAEVPTTRRQSLEVNLRRYLRMGACNVLSLREDDHLSLLSSELKCLNIGIAALFEVQRMDSGEILAGGYIYYWSGHSDCFGVAVTPMIIEVTPVNERIMRIRICHSLDVISLVSACAPTEASDLTMKEALYAMLESVVDQ